MALLALSACDGGTSVRAPSIASANSSGSSSPIESSQSLLSTSANDLPESQARSGSGNRWSEYFGDTDDSDHLTVLAGDSIQLDRCSVNFATLLVAGQLTVNDSLASCDEVTVRAQTVVVSGASARLAIGSNADSFDGKFRLTLTGDVGGSSRHGAEQRMLMVKDAATLEIYGSSAAKRSWSSLEGTVRRGDSVITLAHDTQWQVGDSIVIASSNVEPREAETRVISATDGRTFTLDQPLNFDHFGEQQELDGRILDSRAEVGLLSRNVIVEGDASSALTGIGASLAIVGSSLARPGDDEPLTLVEIEGLELRSVGQVARPERYAFMWYFVGNGRNHFIRNSAIHNSFHRGISVIDTDDVTVENIVSFDITSHAFVPSERGNEVRNTFQSNLAVLTRRIVDHQRFAFPADTLGQSEQSEHRASAFWLRNTFNTVTANRAAGVLGGHGFYYDPVTEQSDLLAYNASGTDRICAFTDNLAHSIYHPLDGSALSLDNAAGFGLFMDHPGSILRTDPVLESRCVFDGVAVYKAHSGGVWLQRNSTLRRAVVADSHVGVVGGDILDDVVVAGQTANALNSYPLPVTETERAPRFAHPENSLGGFYQLPTGPRSSRAKRFNAFSCLDLNACFVSANNEAGEIDQFIDATIDSVRLVGTPQGFIGQFQQANLSESDSINWGQFTDVDGSLTGVPNETRSLSHPDFFDIRLPFDSVHGWNWQL